MEMFSSSKSSIFLHLVIFFALFPSDLFAAPVQANMVSLYNGNDKLVVLVAKNFSTTVYQSETAWLIEFYASWCGHCQRYAKTYREIGIDTWAWKTVVRIGAINCYAEENNPICDQHGVRAYPTLRFIEPHAIFNESKSIQIPATDAKNVEKELITQLEILNRKDSSWPNLTPMNLATSDDLLSHLSSTVKLTLIIVEDRNDLIGRQMMLDFSKYHQELAIFRTEANATLWKNSEKIIDEKPSLFVLFSNRTIEKIDVTPFNSKNGTRETFARAIRSFISTHNFISNIDDREIDEVVLSQNVVQNKEIRSDQINSYQNRLIRHQKLSMVDFETGLSYMLRREIPRYKDIQGDAYDALVHWLIVLTKYFPGRESVMSYLKSVLSKVQDQPDGLTGSEFRKIADVNTETSYLPNNNVNYQFCAGSSPQYRGYPCALWTLFHTLTVSQFQLETTISNPIEIPSAIKGFVKYFFGCQECSQNFMKETKEMNDSPWTEKNAAMIYLWKVHNSVNQRLHAEQNEDPKYPKVQFPPATMCKKCHSTTNVNNSFDVNETIEFLQRFYSKENIDLSMVEKAAVNVVVAESLKSENDSIEISPIESTKRSSSFFTSSSFYFIFALIIIVILIRKRHYENRNVIVNFVSQMFFRASQRTSRFLKRTIMGTAFFFTDEQEIHHRSSIAGASYNLINSIVGSGVIGMSYAFRQSGFLLGFLLLGLVAILTNYSTTILIQSGHLAKATTYQELVFNVMGKTGFLWLSLVQFLYPFICLISYNIIIGDTVTKVLHRLWPTIPILLQNRYFIIFLCSCFVTLPLSLYRNIAKLSQISLAGLILVLTTLIILIKRGFDTMSFIPTDHRYLSPFNYKIAESIGVMAFAFMCQHNSFLIYHSMGEKTLPRWRIVTLITTITAFAFAIAYALTGYTVFGEQTEGDLLENYCHWDTIINIARLIYAINIMLTFPLECLVCRQVIEIVLNPWIHFSSDRSHYVLTSFIVAASVILSLTTDCLGIVLELNGLLVASSLAYILPALCYLKLTPHSNPICPQILLIIGILLTIAGFVLPLRHVLQQGYYCQHGIEPSYCSRMFPSPFNQSAMSSH